MRIGQTADLVVVAPATADVLAKAAHGLADDLLTNTLLTARCPVVFAPAMHTEMWEHAATQDNVATLRRRGALVLEPAEGRLTGADTGKGRLPDPAEIFEVVRDVLGRDGSCQPPRPRRPARGRLRRRHARVPRPGPVPRQPLLGPAGLRPGPRGRGPRRRGDPGRRERHAPGPGRRQGGAGRDDRPAARRRARGGTHCRCRRDGGRARGLPAGRRQRDQDEEGRRRLRATAPAGAEPRHPRGDLPPPSPPRGGDRRVRRGDRGREGVGDGDGEGEARPQGLRPARRQRRVGRPGVRQPRQRGSRPGRRR